MTATATALGSSAGTTASDVTISSIAAGVAAGEVVVVFGGANSTISTFDNADAGSNTYTKGAGGTNSGASPVCTSSFCYSQLTSPDASGTNMVPVLNSGARGRQSFFAVKVDGLTASAFDASASNQAASAGTTATTGSTSTLAQADEIALAAVTTPNAVTCTTPGGWTLVGSSITSVGSNERRVTVFAKVVSATTAINLSVSLSASSSWAASIATFKIDTTPPPAGGTPQVLPFLPIW